MAGSLLLVEGPPGSGKSQRVAEAMEAGEVDVVSDITLLWAAVRGVRRNSEGRYPIRRNDDPALTQGLLSAIQSTTVSLALRRDMRVAVTSGTAGTAAKWAERALVAGAAFSVQTHDPGEEVVRARLVAAFSDEDGNLTRECEQAISRWYG